MPDKYTLGTKRKHPVLKFIGINLIKIIGAFIGIFLIVLLTYFILSHELIMAFASIPLIILVIAFKFKDFKKYYQMKFPDRDHKFKSADKSSLYSKGKPNEITNSYSQLCTDDYFIAETYIHKLVQIIKGKNCFYIHYLKINDNGTGFIEESLITDCENIDNCKKYNSRDYRINFCSVKMIEYSDKEAENTVLKNNGIIMLDTGEKQKHKNKYFYPVSQISDKYIHKFFKCIKKIICFDRKPLNKISYSEAFRKLGKKRISYISLVTLYYISTILLFCIPVYEIQSFFSLLCIAIPTAILIFFCLNSKEYTINDYHRGEESNDFSADTPNVPKSILLPLLVNLLLTLSINITEYSRYLFISLICSIIITVILILFSGSKKAIFPSLMIAAILSFSAVSIINFRLDLKEPDVYSTTIIDKSSTSGYKGGRMYYIKVVLKDHRSVELKVSNEEYNNCDKSDTVEIHEYSGFLNIPYVEVEFD